MPVRSFSVPSGPSRRSAADRVLLHLFAEVVSARQADREQRGRPRWEGPNDTYRLAFSLRAYARALEWYRLPVPPVIRDELRLRSGLPL